MPSTGSNVPVYLEHFAYCIAMEKKNMEKGGANFFSSIPTHTLVYFLEHGKLQWIGTCSLVFLVLLVLLILLVLLGLLYY